MAALPLSAFSHPTPVPHSHIRSQFCCFRSLTAFNGRILAGFAKSLHSTVAFWQVLHILCIRRSRFGTFTSLCILPPHTCPPFPHTITFLLLLLTLSIEWSHFGRFCAISAFNGRVLAAFTLHILTPHTCPPLSHTIAFFKLSLTLSFKPSNIGMFCTISAFDGRVLAGFAQSLHLTVTIWRISSLRILTPRTCPPFSHTITFLQLSLTLSIQPSHFGMFCTISAFDGRVLAAFAQSLHSTVAFWQLFLSPHSHTPHLPPVLAYDGIFAAFAYSQHSTVAFWQVWTISAFDGRVLAGFAQSLHSMVAFWQLFLCPHSHTPHLPPVLAYDHIFAAFAYSRHSMVAFCLVWHNLCIRRSRFGSSSSLHILTPRTCPPFSHTIAFLQLSLTLCIQPSHFGRFCTISAFDGHVWAGLAQSLHSTVAFWQPFLSPHSPTPLLLPVLVCDRILAGFAPSPHSTVAFWQLFLSTLSHTAPASCSRVRSHVCCFRTLSAFDGQILAAFAHCWHSTVAFWHVLLNHSIQRSRFGSFSSPHSPTLPLPPVLPYHRVLAAFTQH